nr:soluble guanylate cyclase 2 [Choanoeca flexa]|eukprot:TRINITY_DN10435_c0_g2_i2.p1 TRINITY_DN10435_c0_g2~~TRINITY_DN10435_c0_g2_i2.p1  ORF type:complete len:805 (+),score=238.40 TRINITY_DN10435_c0_g2_i2:190-2604(+)
MYSIIHMALVEMVSRMEDGEALLKQIFENVEAGDPKGNVYRPFTDQESLRLIETAGKVLEMTIDEVISGMGEVQLATFEKFGYLPLIHALGRDFVEFCQHIDSLHQNLVQSYPSMVAPSFRPELTEDGPMFLHYYSIRPGLWPYAYSLLVAVAKHIYSEDINIDHYQKRHEGHDHDIFAITNVGSHKYNYAASASSKDTGSKALVRRAMTPEQVNDVFPWHVEFDRHLKITSLGSSLASRFDELKLTDLKLFDIIKFQRPSLLRQDFDSFLQYDRQSFLVIVRDATYFLKKQEKKAERKEKRRRARAAAKCPMAQAAEASEPSSSSGANIMQEADMRQIGYLSRSSSASSMEAERFISETVDYLYLKGELIFNEDSQTMFMAGAPHVTKPQEMYLRDMSLSDLPVHSNARELLFSSMHQSATINIARQLEDTMEHLDTARDEMNREKARVEELLHGILPPAIANQLAKGIRPEAERHRSVTILFSDIVGFTKLSSSVKPQSVMNMLNELFSKFDELCDKHEVFKVETIGDAYMVVCGLPTPNERHPVNMARFAIDMASTARTVKSPVDGSPLQIRVGMHSGSVMAGVVGLKAPRYCLFGDAVNTASRMESNSVAGCIQLSASMMSELHALGGGFTIKKRGELEVKGKGRMETFFLMGEGETLDHLVPPESAYDGPGAKPAAAGPVAAQSFIMPTAAPEKEVSYYDILVKLDETTSKVSGVASSTTLKEVLNAVYEQEVTDPAMRLYADEECTEVLVPTQTIDHLLASQVVAAELKLNERTRIVRSVVELYAGIQRGVQAVVGHV